LSRLVIDEKYLIDQLIGAIRRCIKKSLAIFLFRALIAQLPLSGDLH